MTAEHPIILYIGGAERGDALNRLAAEWGWHIYQPTHLMEALAMYVFYQPDAVILETRHDPALAAEAYMHLRSVDCDTFLILAHTELDWDIPNMLSIAVLPESIPAYDVLGVLRGVTARPLYHWMDIGESAAD